MRSEQKGLDELADFRVCLLMVWRHLGLSSPTPFQYQIADIIQNVLKNAGVVPLPVDPEFLTKYPMLAREDGSITHRVIIEAYRGFGKSWISATAAVWCLYWNVMLNIMSLSAAKVKSDEFTTFCLQLIREIPAFNHLAPSKSLGDRCSALAFDVRGHGASQAPSVRSVGIFGQVTGGRADVIFPDDIEVPKTSETQTLREKLIIRSAELGGAVLKPNGAVIVLGTPQCEETVYETMARERGYSKVIFPARYPSEKWVATNGHFLPPKLVRDLAANPSYNTGGGLDGTLGMPADPTRFDEWELQDREAEYGRTGFQLQFMLDTTLSDRERYPLRLRDLIVMDVPEFGAPEKISWGSGPELAWTDLPNVGFRGDRFFRPAFTASQMCDFQGCVMYIDPAGRGKDELAYAIVKSCNGWLYLMECRGLRGGYGETNLIHLATRAKYHKVNEIVTEPNFGDGMFDQLLRPILRDHYPCTLTEGERATTQKEKRIIDTLEPVMNRHLLIVDTKVIREDLISHEDEGVDDTQKRSLTYQMTRLTTDKGCLRFDDRVDALAGAVSYWMAHLGADTDKQNEERRDAQRAEEVHRFLKHAISTSGGDGSPRNPTWF